MAEIIKKMPVPRRAGRQCIYDWDTLLDGKARKLLQGKDFVCLPNSFRQAVYRTANIRRVQVTVQIDGDVVYLQAK